MPTTPFLAGVATRKINPPLGARPVFLAGYHPNRRADGLHTELYARALAFRFDKQVAILVSCDLIGLARSDIDEIRATLARHDIAPEVLIVTCTHTHSAPDTLGLWGPDALTSGVDAVYMAGVKRAVAEAAVEALTFGCPVKMRAATAHLPPGTITSSRTSQLVDDEVAAIQFVRPNGETVGTLLSLACHPTVLPADSTSISADYSGAACRAVEKELGGMALHVSGALGGVTPAPSISRDIGGVDNLGRIYADATLAALAGAELAEVSRLAFRRADFQLPLYNPLFERALRAGQLRLRALDQGLLTTSCALIDLGATQILAVPGEPLPGLGRALKTALPGPLRILAALADDELGYILPDDEFVAPADYAAPGASYEESLSPGPNSGSLLLAAVLGLL
jgi:hypothetical protein